MVAGVYIKSKRCAPKCEHATSSLTCISIMWGGMVESSLPLGGCSFVLQGSAALPLTPTVMCDLVFLPPFPSLFM